MQQGDENRPPSGPSVTAWGGDHRQQGVGWISRAYLRSLSSLAIRRRERSRPGLAPCLGPAPQQASGSPCKGPGVEVRKCGRPQLAGVEAVTPILTLILIFAALRGLNPDPSRTVQERAGRGQWGGVESHTALASSPSGPCARLPGGGLRPTTASARGAAPGGLFWL